MCPAKQSPHPLYIEKPSSDDDLEIIPIKGIDSHEQQPGCKRSLSSNTQSEKCLHFSKPHPHTVGFQSNVPQCTSPTTSTLQPEYHPMKRYESPTNIEQWQTKFSIFSERHPLTILFRSTVPQCTPPFTNPLSTEGHPMNKYELPITMERSEINNSTNDPKKEPHTAGFRPIVLQYTPSVGFTLPPECYPLKRLAPIRGRREAIWKRLHETRASRRRNARLRRSQLAPAIDSISGCTPAHADEKSD